MQPDAGGQNLVVMAVIALAMFLLPLLQRWLTRRVGRTGEEDPAPDASPLPEFRADEPEPRPAEEEIEEPTPVPPPPPPAEAPPRPAIRRLEARVFANRRWSPGAKLLIAKELLDRPRGLRKRP